MQNTLFQTLQWMVQERLLMLIPNFLDPQTCQELIQALEHCPALPAPVDEYGSDRPEAEPRRKTTLLQTPADLNQRVLTPLAALAQPLQEHFRCSLTRQEQPQFLRYDTGDYFKVHTDSTDQAIYRERRLTVIVCLNDHTAFQGGRLAFFLRHPSEPNRYLGVPVPPQLGLLMAFRPDLLHEVSPVTAGQRYTFVTWLAG